MVTTLTIITLFFHKKYEKQEKEAATNFVLLSQSKNMGNSLKLIRTE